MKIKRRSPLKQKRILPEPVCFVRLIRGAIKLLMLAALSSALWSCKSFEWKLDGRQAVHNRLFFNETALVGTGLKSARSGYWPKYCLKRSSVTASGGTFEVRFKHAEAFTRHGDGKLQHFVSENLKRVEKFNLYGYRSLSLMMVVNVKDRVATLDESRLEFRSDIKKLIRKGDLKDFFNRCGTEFIETVTFDSKIYFFLCLYYPEKEKGKFEKIMKDLLSGARGDIFQIALFEKLNYTYPLYYALYSRTGRVYAPRDFFYGKMKKAGLAQFLTETVEAAIASPHGSVKKYTTRRWLILPKTGNLYRSKEALKSGASSPENIYQSLSLLRESIREYRILLRQKSAQGSSGISKEMQSQGNVLTSENMEKCSKEAWDLDRANLLLVPSCFPLAESITRLNRRLYNSSQTGSFDADRFFRLRKNMRPAVVSAFPTAKVPSVYYRYSEAVYSDREQFKKLPPVVKPGRGMDLKGKIYSGKSIDPVSIELSDDGKGSVHSIETNLFPAGQRKKSLWCRIIFFWKDFPSRILYRGSFEVEGSGARLLPSFKLKKKAEALARKNLKVFFDTYGTHYVAQTKTRRGMVWYFSLESKNDRDIALYPYGYSDKPMPGMKAMNKEMKKLTESSCLMRLMFWKKGKKENPLLKPKTVASFFENRQKTLLLMENDQGAVIREMYLEPWSEYLVSNKIVTEEDVILAMEKDKSE